MPVRIDSRQVTSKAQVDALKDAGVITPAQAKALLRGLKPAGEKPTRAAVSAARVALSAGSEAHGSRTAEPPGPLRETQFSFRSPTTGEERFGVSRRHVVSDAELVDARGRPGTGVAWLINGDGAYNPFWRSLDNRSDPALLRAQARFLELSATSTTPEAEVMRAALKALVTKLLVTDGLAERELAYVPKEVAVAVVGRLAAAAGIDLSKVVVRRNTSPGRPLKEWAMEPAKQWQPSYKETRLDRTPEGWKAEIELEARAAKMAAWFDKNPHATLADYSADLEAFERTADHAFWQAMDEMIEQGDLSSMAGRPSLGHGGGGRAYATSPVQPRPVATPAPAAPPATRAAAPAPAPARAARPLPTAWEIVSSRGAYDFFAAKARGYQGSFNDFRSR